MVSVVSGIPSGGLVFGTMPSVFKIRKEADWNTARNAAETAAERTAIPEEDVSSVWGGVPPRRLPELPPQWVNPPVIPPPRRPQTPVDVLIDIIRPKPTEKEMPLDLGGLIGELGGRYIDAKFGGPIARPGPAGGAWDWLEEPNMPGFDLRSPFGPDTSGGSLPGVPGCNDGYTGCDPYRGMVFNPRANCGKGAWVKRKRRRKRLASASDIKDLTSLLSVFGNGKALQTWIATH